MNLQLQYPKTPTIRTGLDGYCDSDWANHETPGRGCPTGNLFRYTDNGCPISSKSKLQKTISLSTAEAEYYSASTSTTEGIWLRDIIRALGFARPGATSLFEDKTGCIEWVTWNNVIGGRESRMRAKHIDIRKHYAYEAIQLTAWTLSAGVSLNHPPACGCAHQGLASSSSSYVHRRHSTPSMAIVRTVLLTRGRTRRCCLSHVGPCEGCLTVALVQGPSPPG
jgi:hypothetical protein